MAFRECSTQAEADAAAVAGEVIMWREGGLILRGSSVAILSGSSSATLHGSSVATLSGSSSATLHGSSHADLYDNSVAVLYGTSLVTLSGNGAAVDGLTGAKLRRDRPRIIIGPLGSRNGKLGVSLPSDGSEPIVHTGCWSGRLSTFAERVDVIYPTERYGDEYRAAIAMIRAIAAIPQGDA